MKRAQKRLSLKSETLTELSNDDMAALAGGNVSDACVGNTNIVCVTVDRCITDYCTNYCFYTVLCK